MKVDVKLDRFYKVSCCAALVSSLVVAVEVVHLIKSQRLCVSFAEGTSPPISHIIRLADSSSKLLPPASNLSRTRPMMAADDDNDADIAARSQPTLPRSLLSKPRKLCLLRFSYVMLLCVFLPLNPFALALTPLKKAPPPPTLSPPQLLQPQMPDTLGHGGF